MKVDRVTVVVRGAAEVPAGVHEALVVQNSDGTTELHVLFRERPKQVIDLDP